MRRTSTLIGILLAVCATILPAPASAAFGNSISDSWHVYPRLIRSSIARPGTIFSTLISHEGSSDFAQVMSSSDDGRHFGTIAKIRARPNEKLSCGTIFELTRRVGAWGPGTLLFAADTGYAKADEGIRVWASSTSGRSWQEVGNPVHHNGNNGVWEPEFNQDNNGALWLNFADESYAPAHSQVLDRISTTNLRNWSAPVMTVAVASKRARPGMPVIRQLTNGTYFLSYEICNFVQSQCAGFFRTSLDGANWGDPTWAGNRVQTDDGSNFQHAQNFTVMPDGRIVMVGQVYVDSNGDPLPDNGSVLLVNDNQGSGSWYSVPSPVFVSNPVDAPCPNYSSALLSTRSGTQVLEIANDYGNGTCIAYYNSRILAMSPNYSTKITHRRR